MKKIKKLIILDLVTLVLAIIFGIFAYIFRRLYFLPDVFIEISIMSIFAFVIGLMFIFIRVLDKSF